MVSRGVRFTLTKVFMLVVILGLVYIIYKSGKHLDVSHVIDTNNDEMVQYNEAKGEIEEIHVKYNNESERRDAMDIGNVDYTINTNISAMREEMEGGQVEYTNISVMREEMLKGSMSYNYSMVKESESNWSIPFFLHFIWLGRSIPDRYVDNIRGFAKNNPLFQVTLWTDEKSMFETSIRQMTIINNNFFVNDLNSNFTHLVNLKIIEEEQNMGAKSDLLRYEIVYQYGGIYVDIDSISLMPLGKEFLQSFVSHTLHPNYNIQNSIFGFPVRSKFLKFVLQNVETNAMLSKLKDFSVPLKYGPPFFTTMFVLFNDTRVQMIHQDYLVRLTNMSIMFQTMDASWKEDKKDDLEEFLKKRIQQRKEEYLENDLDEYEEESYNEYIET